jgi:rod shape-determining protein MreB
VGGDKMDEAILQHIKRKYNLLIGLQTAELIKVTVGSAYPTDEPECIEVKGRDLVTGIPKILTIDSEEVRKAIYEKVETIIETVRIALEQTPPELSADVVDKGIVLTGGGALLKNLDVLLREETRLPITITDDPITTVVLGAGKVLDNLSLLKEITVT